MYDSPLGYCHQYVVRFPLHITGILQSDLIDFNHALLGNPTHLIIWLVAVLGYDSILRVKVFLKLSIVQVNNLAVWSFWDQCKYQAVDGKSLTSGFTLFDILVRKKFNKACLSDEKLVTQSR